MRRAVAGERIIDTIETPETNEEHSQREKLEALVDIICGTGGAQAAGALFVLMGTLQNSTETGALAYTAKHFAFTRCGELNLYGMVDAQQFNPGSAEFNIESGNYMIIPRGSNIGSHEFNIGSGDMIVPSRFKTRSAKSNIELRDYMPDRRQLQLGPLPLTAITRLRHQWKHLTDHDR